MKDWTGILMASLPFVFVAAIGFADIYIQRRRLRRAERERHQPS
jgi:hypothetical protein